MGVLVVLPALDMIGDLLDEATMREDLKFVGEHGAARARCGTVAEREDEWEEET